MATTKPSLTPLLKKMSRSAIQKFIYTPQTPIHKNFRRILHIPHVTPRITKYLKSLDITPAHYSMNSLKSNLLNNQLEKIDKMEKSGIYKIKCGDCNHVYIGQSGRNINIRIKEHFDLGKPSQVADHMRDCNHHTDSRNVEILHFSEKGRRMDLLEAFEIRSYSRRGPLINQQINLIDAPQFDIPLVNS